MAIISDPHLERTPAIEQPPEVMSYIAVRRAVGIIGLALPVVLLLYASVVPGGMRPSISEFYHSHMGDVLVGTLVAIGIFLIAYKGYDPQDGEIITDNLIANIAGFTAIGVALFPTFTFPEPDPRCPLPAGTTQGFYLHWCTQLENVHFYSAAAFFVMMAVFCLYLFPRGDRKADGKINWTTGKNRIYLTCGLALIVSIGALLIYAVSDEATGAALRAVNYVFWFETLGVVAFAIAWLTKGKIEQLVAG